MAAGVRPVAARWGWLLAALVAGCAGEEKSPLPYYGLAGDPGTAGGAAGAGGGAPAGGAGQGGSVASGAVVINEIDPSGEPADWIELKNRSAAPVDVSGWVLAQNFDGSTPPDDASKLVLPAGSVLPPGGYLVVFTRLSSGPGPGDFGISKSASERISLLDPGGALLDDTSTDGSAEQPFPTGTSWGRLPDGEGAFGRRGSTKGATNGM